MVKIKSHPLYQEDMKYICELPLPLEKLEGKRIFLSGATGLIGTLLVDSLMMRNRLKGSRVEIVGAGRSRERMLARFGEYENDPLFHFQCCDVNEKIEAEGRYDYVIHAASNTHPRQYAEDPVGTIMTNIEGTKNILDLAEKTNACRTVFLSSVEVYGENRGDTEYFDEDYCGYIDCNTLRAGYPEGKRAGEALCQAYRKAHGMDIVIPRLSRTYGPTMSDGDSKAIAQFLKKGIAGEDIILKSEGTQLYSYSYAADAVAGILYIMLLGEDGEAYNISDEKSDITLRELASMIAQAAGTQVVFDLPDETEKAGYSKATKALLSNKKLSALGWEAGYSMMEGVGRTMEICRDGKA